MIKDSSPRIQGIDLLRGIVMIIMVLDHARFYFHADAFVYDPLDLSQTSAFLFFTRWITHYCAAVFVFLAGTSAFLAGRKKEPRELSNYLLSRGLWLILLEVTVVNFGWFFNPLLNFTILQVIWAIGVSMVTLSLLVRLPVKFIFIVGAVIVFGHNLLDGFHVSANSIGGVLWSLLHESKSFTVGDGRTLLVVYPVLPWIGTMALGYCFGTLYTESYTAAKRQQILTYIGVGAILLFVVLRLSNFYGDAKSWTVQSTPLFTLLSILDTTKYPPSLLYLLMTLGPSILFLAFAERVPNFLSQRIMVFGKVPMFYYLMHIYVLHTLAVMLAVFSGYPASSMVFSTWISQSPELSGYGFNLGVVYFIWAIVVVGLYPLCRHYENYKRRNRQQVWLSYL